MPELPEVETVRAALEGAVLHKRIRQVVLRRGGLRTPFATDFARRLEGAAITGVARRAKYLLIGLDNDYTWLAHLGMSGCFSYHGDDAPLPGAHDHVTVHFTDDSTLTFCDPRRFGLMEAVKTAELGKHRLLAHLGLEPLDDEFTPAYLAQKLAARRSPVKVALMDQELVVGVGNIYASEALFLAGIHPARQAFEVADKAPALVSAIRQVLQEAIASGGSSLRDFATLDGSTGYFQHKFRVYGRKGQKCQCCGHMVEVMRQAGRSTFFCPNCQK